MEYFTSLPIPEDEKARLASVLDYGILDTEKDADLDELTRLTSSIFDVPIVLITILDDKRQWFKSNLGLSIHETERSISFCQYTIMGDDIVEVENTALDERFSANPLVIQEPFIRFYCGAPLINAQGFKMGSLALIDRKPRKLDEKQKTILKLFSKQVVNYFELNIKTRELEREKVLLEKRVLERTLEIENALKEIKESDRKLTIANNELSQFIYKITHNLLGPIKTMLGITDVILHETKEKKILDYLKLLKTTEQRMDQSLSSLVKYLTTKNSNELSIILWEQALTTSFDNSKKRLEKPEAKLVIENTSTEPLVCNQVLLTLLMEELFTNSIQYNLNPTPTIHVKISDHIDHQLLLEVKDNGIGIREEHLEKIFEMFFKTDQSKSSGLGLYIVKKIVEKLNGTIIVESKKNEGSTFKVLIPLKKQ